MNNEVSNDQSGRLFLRNQRYMDKFKGAVFNLAISDPLRPFTPERKAQISQFLANFSPILTSIPSHVTYAAMIHRAITDLDKKSGCSEEDISRFIGSTYSNLPWAHSPLLKIHLGNLCQNGEIFLSNGCYSLVEVVDSVPDPRKGRNTKRKRIQKQVNCLSLGEKPRKRRRREKLQKLNGSVVSESTEKHIHKKEGGTEEKNNVGGQSRGPTIDQGKMKDDYDLEDDKFQVDAGKNKSHVVFDNVYMEHDHKDEHDIYAGCDDDKRFRHQKCMQHTENAVEDDMENNDGKTCSGVDHSGKKSVEESTSVDLAMSGMVGKHEELHTEEVARKFVELGEMNGKTQSSIDHLIQFPEIQNPEKVNKDILFLESAACVKVERALTETKETNGKTTPSDLINDYQSVKRQICVFEEKSQKFDTDIEAQLSLNEVNGSIMPNEIDIDCRPLRHQIIDTEKCNVFGDDVVPKVDALVRNNQILPQSNEHASKKLDMGILSAKPFSQVTYIQGSHWNPDLALLPKNTHIIDKRISSINIDNMEDDEVEYLGNECRDIVLDHCSQPLPVMQNMENNLEWIKSDGSSFTGQAGIQHFKLKRVLRSGVCCFIKSQNTDNKMPPVSMPVEEDLPNRQARVDGLLQNQPHIQRRRGKVDGLLLNQPHVQRSRGRPRKHSQKPPTGLPKKQKPPALNLPRKGRGRPSKMKLT